VIERKKFKKSLVLTFLAAKDQHQFSDLYRIVETYRKELKKLYCNYVVDYGHHAKLMISFVKEIRAATSPPLSKKVEIQLALLLHSFYEQLLEVEHSLLLKMQGKARTLRFKVLAEESFTQAVGKFVEDCCDCFTELEKFMKASIRHELQLQPCQLS
jgi:hypothetical protein